MPNQAVVTLRLLLLAASLPISTVAAAAQCSAQSGATPPTVVELYTSEGCSSCPPADKWLSTLKGRNDVVALAFHVNYWDHLGWRDRFAAPAYTERQRELMRPSGSRYVYTPQVIVNGADWRQWPSLPTAKPAAGVPSVALRREGAAVVADIGVGAGQFAAYWVLLADGQASKVRAGENSGETLRHDHVVRSYLPVAAWDGKAAKQLRWEPPQIESARRVGLVLTDANGDKPVQAAMLGC